MLAACGRFGRGGFQPYFVLPLVRVSYSSFSPVTDPRLEPVLLAAVSRIQSAAQSAATQVVDMLGLAAMSAASNAQRQSFTAAQFDLRHKMTAFNQTFSRVLYEKVTGDLRRPRDSSGGGLTDWQSLTLVDESEMEEQVLADRLAADMAQECEWELRELGNFIAPLLDALPGAAPRGEQDRNPLRPRNIGKALFRSVQATSDDPEVRKLLAKEVGRVLGQSLRASYQAVIEDLRQRGVQPTGLSARSVAPPTPSGGSEAGRMAAAEAEAAASAAGAAAAARSDMQFARALGAMFGIAVPPGFAASGTGASGFDRGTGAGSSGFGSGTSTSGSSVSGVRSGPGSGVGSSGTGGSSGFGGVQSGAHPAARSAAGGALGGGASGGGYASGGSVAADAAMMEVIRRLAVLSTHTGAVDGGWTPSGAGGFAMSAAGAVTGGDVGAVGTSGAGGLGGLMAVNLIRAHREELMRATGAPLDHMVIDVVAALFDQVLSDPKVPPQMARQIARLQLPVLRVALKDMNFFSSRKHPVRRFVNRIASVAASFDDFEAGPGRECLRRVSSLVQEVVDGDFDQMALYEAKLAELETFIREQTAAAAESHQDATAVLVGKEADLRIQQRYMRALQAQLASLQVEDFLRDFISQVWSQVQVLALAREGADAPFAQRMKRVPRELILSVQPKGTPQLRKEFLVRLPQLMKDLNEGLALIRWPEDAKKDFFAKLLPAHAQALKAAPATDFARRQLDFQIEQVEKVAIPSRDDVAGDTSPVLMAEATVAEVNLTPQEAEQVGLVDEQAIDWGGALDIDLDEAVVSTAEVDINLDSPPPPTAGAQLVSHIQPGVAYQMHLNDAWKKVRLSWVSPGRTFFIFTYGRMYKQTISLTARTLLKMCESGRFRAFEQAELIERATARARKQLAALGSSSTTRPHG